MNIFNGIEILFFVLGALFVLLVFGVINMKKSYIMDWKSNILAAVGIPLSLFCIAWSVSSVLEGEPQAAAMGVLIFGLPVLLIYGVFRRLVVRIDG